MPLRRRGSQHRRLRHRRVELADTDHRPFEELVADALDGLPEQVQRLLANVALVIEDEPSAEQRRQSELAPDETLYGLYEGTSAVTYGADWAQLPNKISLFRLPLEEDFPDPAELATEVQRTVVHELAHHAGFDEPELEKRGLG